MANIDISKLPPQLQQALFEASKQQGNQPTSGGIPMNQAPTAEPAPQAPMLQRQPGDKMDPNEAMAIINQQFSQQLGQNKAGQLTQKVPTGQPILDLFGVKRSVPIKSPDYFQAAQAQGLTLPDNLPRKPDGTPFVSDEVFKTVLASSKGTPKRDETPDPKLGKLALSILERQYGKGTPEFENAREYIEGAGGLSPNRMGEWKSFTMPTKENDFVMGPDKIMRKYNRATDSYEAVPGQSAGALAVLQDPLSLGVFNIQRQRFDSDLAIKEYKKSIELLGNTSAILESDNPAAIGVLFSNIAKSIGKEAGVLTEGDIARAVGDPGWGAQLYRWYSKRADFINGKGKLSEKDLKDFRGLFKDIAGAAQKRYDASVNKHIKSTMTMLPGVPESFIRTAFDVAPGYLPADERRLPGQATHHEAGAGQTKKGTKYRVIQ